MRSGSQFLSALPSFIWSIGYHKLRGHSTSTWAKFYQILTPSPLKWTIVYIVCHVTKRGLSNDSLPPLLVHIVIEWPLTKVWVNKTAYVFCDQINSLNFWLFKLFLVYLAVQTFLSISSDITSYTMIIIKAITKYMSEILIKISTKKYQIIISKKSSCWAFWSHQKILFWVSCKSIKALHITRINWWEDSGFEGAWILPFFPPIWKQLGLLEL